MIKIRTGRVDVSLSLPRRVRFRLAATRRVDKTAIWLTEHDHYQAATWLWRACGLW